MIRGLLYLKLSHLPYRCHLLNFRLNQLATTMFNLWQYFHNTLETNSSFWLWLQETYPESPHWLRGGNLGPTTPMHPKWETEKRVQCPSVRNKRFLQCICSRAEAKNYGDGEQIPCVELSDSLNSVLFYCWGGWSFQIIHKFKNLSLGVVFSPS